MTRTPRTIDDVIDQAASEYSVVDSSPGLRARVLDKIETAPRWRWPWFAVPAAVTAVAVVAVVISVGRPRDVPSIGRPASAVVAVAGSPIDVARLAPVDVPVAPARPLPGDAEAALESASARAWRERALLALPVPSALTVARIQPVAVDLPLLVVEPLATTRLALEPLTPGRPVQR